MTLPIIALAIGGIATDLAAGARLGARRPVARLRPHAPQLGDSARNRVVYKHVLRNAGGPALALLAVQFIGMIGGAVIVEQIFALPGIGSADRDGDLARATSPS